MAPSSAHAFSRATRRRGRLTLAATVLLVPTTLAFASLMASCKSEELPPVVPTFRDDVAPLFQAKCVQCHQGDTPAGGWRATSYMDAIGCVASDGSGATLPSDDPDKSPILRALDPSNPDHTHTGSLPAAQRATDADRALLRAWIAGGAPSFRGAVHDPSWADPRSSGHHSKWLRDRQWKPMLDPNDPDACGKCHSGSPATPPGITSFAPGATACTSCHNQSGGPLNCTTCHGNGNKPYAPRDTCFFPLDPVAKAISDNHDAHLQAGQYNSRPLQCTACHVLPGPGVIGGTHGNGQIDVVMATGVAGANASYDTASNQCTNRCHTGIDAARPHPSFRDTDKVKCGDCHGAPPHSPGAPNGQVHFLAPSPEQNKGCSFCHKEVVVDSVGKPVGLVQPVNLHMNGKVDLGDGSGQCNACHGNTGTAPAPVDPMPTTGAHDAHRAPDFSQPVACTTCHVVPTSASKHPIGDGQAHITFSGVAVTGGAAPKFDATAKTCSFTYCHSSIPGGFLATSTPPIQPYWYQDPNDANGAGVCGACHGVPPPNHFQGTCGANFCHSGIITPDPSSPKGVSILPAASTVHVNGRIDVTYP